MDSLGYIYCIENTINSRKYIGKHCGSDENYFGSGVALKKAIKKYGKEVFTKTVLEYCVLDRLDEREKYWITYYNTYLGEGYNLTPGGDGWTKGMEHTKESAEKISKSKKGKVQISDEQRSQIRESLTRYYSELTPQQRSDIYGVGGRSQKGIKKTPFTDAHKQNLSKGQRGKPKKQSKEHRAKIGAARRKPVAMYNLLGELVCVYPSITEAAKSIGGSASEVLKSCKNGKTSVKGYRFKKVAR